MHELLQLLEFLAYCFLLLAATLLEQHFPSEQKYDNSNSLWWSRQDDEHEESVCCTAFTFWAVQHCSVNPKHFLNIKISHHWLMIQE